MKDRDRQLRGMELERRAGKSQILVPQKEEKLALYGEMETLHTRLVGSDSEHRAKANQLVRERDPDARGVLKRQVSLLRQNKFRAKRILEKLAAIEPSIRLHHERFRNGRHPQEEALLRIADHEKVPPAEVYSDLRSFAQLLMKLAYGYPFIEEEMKSRDRKFRAEFTQFRHRRHELQAEIEELATQRGLSLGSMGGEDAYRAFVSLAKEEATLELIQEGLRPESLQVRLVEAERREQEAQVQAHHHQRKALEAAALSEKNEQERRKAQKDLNKERSLRKLAEKDTLKHEAQLRTTAEQLRIVQKELADEQSGRRKQQERLDRLRDEIIVRVQEIRDQEASRISEGSGGMQLDPHLGFLMIESRRVLNAEFREGARESQSDYFFFQIVKELITLNDFEDRFLHQEGRQIVDMLNAYFAGRTSLSEAVSGVQEVDLQLHRLAPKQISRPTGNWTVDLVEAWIVPHRDHQRAQYRLFASKAHPDQQIVERTLRQEGIPLSLTEPAWLSAWDSAPDTFVAALEKMAQKEYNLI